MHPEWRLPPCQRWWEPWLWGTAALMIALWLYGFWKIYN
jgi:hypothetical protein